MAFRKTKESYIPVGNLVYCSAEFRETNPLKRLWYWFRYRKIKSICIPPGSIGFTAYIHDQKQKTPGDQA